MGNNDGPVLSFATKYYFLATYHLNVQLCKAGAAARFQILNLDITDGGAAIVIT